MSFQPRLVKKQSGTHGYPGYVVTNESIGAHNQLLGDRQFSTIGAIASGGEVTLCCLVHRAVNRVYAVDVNSGVLDVFYLKMLMLNEFGAEKTRDLLVMSSTPVNDRKFAEEVKNLVPQLPHISDRAFSHEYYKTVYRQTSSVWKTLSLDALHYTSKNLSKIVLIHGDLAEAMRESGAAFDLLYSSNAVGYTQKYPTHVEVAPFVREGGLQLTTTAHWRDYEGTDYAKSYASPEATANGKAERELWELAGEVKNARSTSMSWDHWLLRRKFAQVQEKAA